MLQNLSWLKPVRGRYEFVLFLLGYTIRLDYVQILCVRKKSSVTYFFRFPFLMFFLCVFLGFFFPISFPALMFSLAVSFFGFFLSFSPVPVMFSYVFFVHSVSFIFHFQLDVVPSNCFYTHSVFFFASHAAVGWGRVSVPLPTGPAGPLRPCRRPPGSVAVA